MAGTKSTQTSQSGPETDAPEAGVAGPGLGSENSVAQAAMEAEKDGKVRAWIDSGLNAHVGTWWANEQGRIATILNGILNQGAAKVLDGGSDDSGTIRLAGLGPLPKVQAEHPDLGWFTFHADPSEFGFGYTITKGESGNVVVELDTDGHIELWGGGTGVVIAVRPRLKTNSNAGCRFVFSQGMFGGNEGEADVDFGKVDVEEV